MSPAFPDDIESQASIFEGLRKSRTQPHVLRWLLSASPAPGTSSGTVKPKAKRAGPEHSSACLNNTTKGSRDLGKSAVNTGSGADGEVRPQHPKSGSIGKHLLCKHWDPNPDPRTQGQPDG